MVEDNKKAVIEPIMFLDMENKNKTINTTESFEKAKAELKLNCRYGNFTINLSELPIIKNFV